MDTEPAPDGTDTGQASTREADEQTVYVSFREDRKLAHKGQRKGAYSYRYFLVDAHGNETLAAYAEDQGDAHYLYKSVDGFSLGPPLACHNRRELLSWLEGVVQGTQQAAGFHLEQDDDAVLAETVKERGAAAPLPTYIAYRRENFMYEDGHRGIHWWLVDNNKHEHLAVTGEERETRDGHYTYRAEEPLNSIHPFESGNANGVYAYLDQLTTHPDSGSGGQASDHHAAGGHSSPGRSPIKRFVTGTRSPRKRVSSSVHSPKSKASPSKRAFELPRPPPHLSLDSPQSLFPQPHTSGEGWTPGVFRPPGSAVHAPSRFQPDTSAGTADAAVDLSRTSYAGFLGAQQGPGADRTGASSQAVPLYASLKKDAHQHHFQHSRLAILGAPASEKRSAPPGAFDVHEAVQQARAKRQKQAEEASERAARDAVLTTIRSTGAELAASYEQAKRAALEWLRAPPAPAEVELAQLHLTTAREALQELEELQAPVIATSDGPAPPDVNSDGAGDTELDGAASDAAMDDVPAVLLGGSDGIGPAALGDGAADQHAAAGPRPLSAAARSTAYAALGLSPAPDDVARQPSSFGRDGADMDGDTQMLDALDGLAAPSSSALTSPPPATIPASAAAAAANGDRVQQAQQAQHAQPAAPLTLGIGSAADPQFTARRVQLLTEAQDALRELASMHLSLRLVAATGLVKAVGELRQHPEPSIAQLASWLADQWQRIVARHLTVLTDPRYLQDPQTEAERVIQKGQAAITGTVIPPAVTWHALAASAPQAATAGALVWPPAALPAAYGGASGSQMAFGAAAAPVVRGDPGHGGTAGYTSGFGAVPANGSRTGPPMASPSWLAQGPGNLDVPGTAAASNPSKPPAAAANRTVERRRLDRELSTPAPAFGPAEAANRAAAAAAAAARLQLTTPAGSQRSASPSKAPSELPADAAPSEGTAAAATRPPSPAKVSMAQSALPARQGSSPPASPSRPPLGRPASPERATMEAMAAVGALADSLQQDGEANPQQQGPSSGGAALASVSADGGDAGKLQSNVGPPADLPDAVEQPADGLQAAADQVDRAERQAGERAAAVTPAEDVVMTAAEPDVAAEGAEQPIGPSADLGGALAASQQGPSGSGGNGDEDQLAAADGTAPGADAEAEGPMEAEGTLPDEAPAADVEPPPAEPVEPAEVAQAIDADAEPQPDAEAGDQPDDKQAESEAVPEPALDPSTVSGAKSQPESSSKAGSGSQTPSPSGPATASKAGKASAAGKSGKAARTARARKAALASKAARAKALAASQAEPAESEAAGKSVDAAPDTAAGEPPSASKAATETMEAAEADEPAAASKPAPRGKAASSGKATKGVSRKSSRASVTAPSPPSASASDAAAAAEGGAGSGGKSASTSKTSKSPKDPAAAPASAPKTAPSKAKAAGKAGKAGSGKSKGAKGAGEDAEAGASAPAGDPEWDMPPETVVDEEEDDFTDTPLGRTIVFLRSQKERLSNCRFGHVVPIVSATVDGALARLNLHNWSRSRTPLRSIKELGASLMRDAQKLSRDKSTALNKRLKREVLQSLDNLLAKIEAIK